MTTANNTTQILIIDDETIVLKSCEKILKKRDDVEIDTALNGIEGLEKTKSRKYDIVITDLKMPHISGMDVLKTLKQDQPELTVIIFTGFATVETTREALKLGAFDYIPKPFTPDELLSVVDNAIQSRQNKAETAMLDLMAIVSHELKSPVSVVHTTAETLYKGYFGNLSQEQQKIIETILRNTQYLEDIIRNYLDLSKMELDSLESFQQKLDFYNDVIKPIVEIPEHCNNIKNMKLELNIAVKPKILGDANLLKIVITNLINNAIKYGKAHSVIKIDLQHINREYVFSVLNEGVGIPDDAKDKLFKKFTRLKQKGTEGIKGSGLGLYICKSIVEKHKGRIWAESSYGSWAKFSFSVPII